MPSGHLGFSRVGLGYNVMLALVGGTSPMAATWLVYRTGYEISPGLLIALGAGLSFLAVLGLSRSARQDLGMERAPAPP